MDEYVMLAAVCPECRQSISFRAEPPLNHLLLCPHCETILTVTAVRPLQLDWAFEEPTEPEDTNRRSPTQSHWQFRAGRR